MPDRSRAISGVVDGAHAGSSLVNFPVKLTRQTARASGEPILGAGAYLQHELKRRQSRNPRYSLRAFGRDLGVHHATVSKWMRETRPVTRDALEYLCKRLGVSGAAIEQMASFDPFDLEVVEFAAGMKRPTAPRIARHFKCSTDKVNISLNRLLRLGMLKMKQDRWIVPDKE